MLAKLGEIGKNLGGGRVCGDSWILEIVASWATLTVHETLNFAEILDTLYGDSKRGIIIAVGFENQIFEIDGTHKHRSREGHIISIYFPES